MLVLGVKAGNWRTADGRELARSGMVGWQVRRPTPTADPALRLEHQVFPMWCEWVVARRWAITASDVRDAELQWGT